MTGNNKVWRAPVAGLASVAMLATMGVTTANAVTVNAADAQTVTVTVKGEKVTLFKGMTYADAIASSDWATGATDELNGHADWTFGGFRTKSGEAVDLNAVAENGAVLEPVNYDQTESVLVHFVTDTEKDLGYIRVPLQDHEFSVPAELAPYDIADGMILSTTGLKWQAGSSSGLNDFAYGKTVPLQSGVSAVTVIIPTVEAYIVDFDDNAAAGSDTGYSSLTYAGAYADSAKNSELSVEVDKSVGKLDPATVAEKMIVNLSGKQSYSVDGWKDSSGQDFTADTVIKADVRTVKPLMKAAYTVTFMDGDKQYATQSVVHGHLATEPAAPSHDDKTFIGWSTDKQTGTTAGKLWIFSADKVNGNTTLYAQYANGGSHTLTYKFNDGKTADKVETYRAKQNTARPSDPTRDGYLFAGWYVDTNENGIPESTETTKFSFGSVLTTNTVLVARWLKADDATLQAAFNYVNGSDESNNANYGNIFTDASFAEYVKSYQSIQKEYAQAQDEATAAGTQIPAETLSKLVNELTAAWQKLEFVHTGSSQISSAVVHRLSKGGDHFYTQDLNEIKYMVDYQGWTDEGRLFQTTPRDGAQLYLSLASFSAAAGSADVEATLDSIADPILTEVTRLYNRANGDHVWSTDENEVSVLSAQANWNNEGGAFFVPTYTGGQAVTRLYKGSRHLLSTDSNEIKVLSAQGWNNEGTAFKAY